MSAHHVIGASTIASIFDAMLGRKQRKAKKDTSHISLPSNQLRDKTWERIAVRQLPPMIAPKFIETQTGGFGTAGVRWEDEREYVLVKHGEEDL